MGVFSVATVALLLFIPTLSWADRSLSEKEILARCYAQLTGQRLSVGDPLWTRLKSQAAGQVCASLIDEVQLGANGLLTQSANPLHRRILKQFQDIHRSWFPAQWPIDGNSSELYFGTLDIYDASEPALFVTLSLFSQQFSPYQNVLRGSNSLYAVRDPATINGSALGSSGFPRPSKILIGDDLPADQMLPVGVLSTSAVTTQDGGNGYASIPTPLIQMGAMTGIQVWSNETPVPTLWTGSSSPSAQVNAPGILSPQALHKSYGGGALGSAPFLLLNFGHSYDYVSNGTTKLPRRVIMTAMNSFLCLPGPFAREGDVSSYLVSESDPQAAPFRKSVSCLRCHVTLDSAALTLRHLQLGTTTNISPVSGIRSPAMVVSAASDAGAMDWPVHPTPSFNRTSPTGRVIFRSVTGGLVSQQVGNLEGLGQALSTTDDYYACAASRYFKYFTGIDVHLFDPQDPANQSSMTGMNDKDREYRQYVLGLGKELQTTQSLKTLVKHILQSGYYRRAAYGR